MAKVKSRSDGFSSATSKAVVPAGSGKNSPSAPLTLDDFTGEYRDVVKDLLVMKRRNAQTSGYPLNPVLTKVVEQAVMRVVHVGQKQRIPPSRVKKMVTASAVAARSTPEWQPQKSLERRAGMLAGSPKMRKIG